MANKQSTHKVLIENAIFHSFHGLQKEEQIVGGKFEVNLEITTNFSSAASEDDISGTVDYSAVYDLIEKELQKPSKLIEHLAQRILDRIRSEFNDIEQLKIKISKLNPPISGEISSVSVIIEE